MTGIYYTALSVVMQVSELKRDIREQYIDCLRSGMLIQNSEITKK